VVKQKQLLQAELKVSHSGTGILRGAWQIAEPGSSESKPIFKTLRTVAQQLSKQQFNVVTSPVLPTNKTGKYILRFCVSDFANVSNQDLMCPGVQVETVYQVVSAIDKVLPIKLQSPGKGSVSADTVFSWQPAANTVVYQLQVFSYQPNTEAEFIVGLLLPNNKTQSPLSPLVLNSLTDGLQYQWRINALNSEGMTVAQSELSQFLYTP
jgi:hypothetical protein